EAVVLYKPVKNLHLNVLPPVGKVRVTAPQNMNDDAIRTFLATRISWIKRMQAKFKGQERQTSREYVSGETHYYFGNKYKLEVVEAERSPNVSIKGKSKILLSIKPKTDILKREKIMQKWYREELRMFLNKAITKWETKIAVKASNWGIRRMKTRWGTCNHKAKSIWLNLELTKKPEHCIEYAVVHELIHLIEEKHSDKFMALMNKHLPKWKSEKEELNRLILAHEEWRS
ncbi:M48 family metallopeptidase, partial [Candidatus Micrarchaeota archaeon]|nr:M48 family metallopeptidase [Candidatus Micrarchaeota archaeon]